MTLQMTIGKMIAGKIVGRPGKYPERVVDRAQNVLKNFTCYDDEGRLNSKKVLLWHNGPSWTEFKEAAARHDIDLSTILQDEK
jgi:hypothetical protein